MNFDHVEKFNIDRSQPLFLVHGRVDIIFHCLGKFGMLLQVVGELITTCGVGFGVTTA